MVKEHEGINFKKTNTARESRYRSDNLANKKNHAPAIEESRKAFAT